MREEYDFSESIRYPGPSVGSNWPTELYESDEMGDFTLICPENQYKSDIQSCIDSGFDPDFNPEPVIWNLVDPKEGVYEKTTSGTKDGKWVHTTIKAKMTWSESLGSFKVEELETTIA
jgi:hypothetical protein